MGTFINVITNCVMTGSEMQREEEFPEVKVEFQVKFLIKNIHEL